MPGQGWVLPPVKMVKKLGFALLALLSAARLRQAVCALLLDSPYSLLFPHCPLHTLHASEEPD